MKVLFAAALLLLLGAAEGANVEARGVRRRSGGGLHNRSVAVRADGSMIEEAKASVSLDQVLEGMVGEYFDNLVTASGPNAGHVVESAFERMNLAEALKRLSGKLPDHVQSLMNVADGQQVSVKQDLSEESMEKARKILNSLIEQAIAELDNVVIECLGFKEKNRGTIKQVSTDLSRLGQQLATLAESRTEAIATINQNDLDFKDAEAKLEDETSQYTTQNIIDHAELTKRQNDLAVFTFILEATKCDDGDVEFLQTSGNSSPVHVCSNNGQFEFRMTDKVMEAKLERMMTPSARLLVHEALALSNGGGAAHSLLQRATTTTSTTTTQQLVLTVAAAPVADAPAQSLPQPADTCCGPTGGGIANKCVDGKPNCGLLHDNMAKYWGTSKDAVDELLADMKDRKDKYDAKVATLTSQMKTASSQKDEGNMALSAAVAGLNADGAQETLKKEQYQELETEYTLACKKYKKKITEILFTNICAVKKVRNELLSKSTVSPPEEIKDCDVGDWENKGECNMPCDDSCPDPDPFKCGGKITIKRELVQERNDKGINCPSMELTRLCNQKKCEVDCVVSRWSDWADCSKVCGGGVEQRTRSKLVTPLNGGKACPGFVEERACNTGSCNRDCSLRAWTEWSPCSMACKPEDEGGPVNTGTSTRIRKVDIPIRADGKCPKPATRSRLETRKCNENPCQGDEICIAQQDVIFVIDGSGSVKQEGFDIIKKFALNFTGRYKSEYFGKKDVKMGVILIGNGKLEASGAVAPALWVVGLTEDVPAVEEKIEGMKWQRGFTNLAQGFALAANMNQRGGRTYAQTQIIVVSDGKINNLYQAIQQATKLKDMSMNVAMATIAASPTKDVKEAIKEIVSAPTETNSFTIPGFEALKYNYNAFAQQFIATFCPKSMSPSARAMAEDARGYILLKEKGYPSNDCGTWYDLGSQTKDDCALAARNKGLKAFSWKSVPLADPTTDVRHCYGEAVDFTPEEYQEYKNAREAPPCPNGDWIYNPYYNTYFMNYA